jgi:probable rRNA maturation factor
MVIAIKNNQRRIKANHRTIEKVLRRALTHLAHKGCHALLSDRQILKHLEVSVLFVNDAGMRRLNYLYRGMDRTTDVLSFPLQVNEKLPSASNLLLGDIVISLPQTMRQADEYETTFYQELARLLVHGLLHLLGYDHEKNSYQAVKMRRLEAELAEVLCP